MPTFVIKICTLSLIVCTSLEPQNRNEGKDGLDNWKSEEKNFYCARFKIFRHVYGIVY